MDRFRDEMLKNHELAKKAAQEKKKLDIAAGIDNERVQTQKAIEAITARIKECIELNVKSNTISCVPFSKKRKYFSGSCTFGIMIKEATNKPVVSTRFMDHRGDDTDSYSSDFGLAAPISTVLKIAGAVYDVLVNDGLVCPCLEAFRERRLSRSFLRA